MQKNTLPKIGMVFGVFDGFHPGHQFFLKEAMGRCEKLIVVVALPEVVKKIKKRTPLYSHEERMQTVQSFDLSLTAVPSDEEIGTWQVLKKHTPDMIFLGYDQQALGEALREIHMPYVFIDPHYPEKYKSGLLNRKVS